MANASTNASQTPLKTKLSSDFPMKKVWRFPGNAIKLYDPPGERRRQSVLAASAT
jgi:hypothetical protein